MAVRERRSLKREPAGAAPARRNRGLLLLVVIALLVAAAIGWALLRNAGGGARGTPRARNLLLITLDTTRADFLGCYGHAGARTPHLDRLAREGLLFERCTSCAPTTLPSHSSMMTALYPYAHGARRNGTGRLADANVTLAETLKAAGYYTAAAVSSFVLNRQFGVAQGFDEYRDVPPSAAGSPLAAERKGAQVTADVLELLDAASTRPFFIWAHYYDPHFPYESARFPDVTSRGAYGDEITYMDAEIGRLLDRLAQLGHDRDTLVIAVGDHGEGLGDHDELMHGYFLYETTTHVPLIMRGPGIPPGTRCAAQVRTIDLAPTALAVLGLPEWPQAQGVSLTALLADPSRDLDLAAYGETFDAHVEFGLAALRSWTHAGWKLIHAPRAELYNLPVDPGERSNLAAGEAERLAHQRAQLRELLADAPPPPSLQESSVAQTSEDIARLQAIGYAGGGGVVADPSIPEVERFEPTGGNPGDFTRHIEWLAREFPRLQAEQRYAEAEQNLRAMAAAMPESARVQVHLASTLLSLERMDEAEAAFQRAVELAPQDADARRKYATFLVRHKRPADALAHLREVIRELPDDTAALEQIALAHVALDQLAEAEQALLAARAVDGRNLRILKLLGVLYEQQQRWLQAQQVYADALRVDPECRECAEGLQRAAQSLGW